MSSPQEVDDAVSRKLNEAENILQRQFGEGLVTVGNLRKSFRALESLAALFKSESILERSEELNESIEHELEKASIPKDASPKKHVAVFMDGSPQAYTALRWALKENLILSGSNDHLFLVNIMPNRGFEEDSKEILRAAYEVAHHFGVGVSQITKKSIVAQESSADPIGRCIVQFAEDEHIDVAILGDRGMGNIKESLLKSIGLGSVSYFCAHHLRCPVLVVKNDDEVQSI